MRRSNFALRLQPSLLEELRGIAAAEDVPLNQFINVAVAEKLAALKTAAYFRERAANANVPGALKILKRLGVGTSPRVGDEPHGQAKVRAHRRSARSRTIRGRERNRGH